MEARLVCVECEASADWSAVGWEAHLIDVEDDGNHEIVIYCPRCAQREFHDPDWELPRPGS